MSRFRQAFHVAEAIAKQDVIVSRGSVAPASIVHCLRSLRILLQIHIIHRVDLSTTDDFRLLFIRYVTKMNSPNAAAMPASRASLRVLFERSHAISASEIRAAIAPPGSLNIAGGASFRFRRTGNAAQVAA